MSGASKQGTKLVVIAVGGTLAALGIGTIYLPFYADRDKVRGLHEESELSSSERAEYERVMKEMGQLHAANSTDGDNQAQRPDRVASNNMWTRMNKAAGPPK